MSPTSYQTAPPRVSIVPSIASGGEASRDALIRTPGRSMTFPHREGLFDIPQGPQPLLRFARLADAFVRRRLAFGVADPDGEGGAQAGVSAALAAQDVRRLAGISGE